jgi:hypothetical protein
VTAVKPKRWIEMVEIVFPMTMVVVVVVVVVVIVVVMVIVVDS